MLTSFTNLDNRKKNTLTITKTFTPLKSYPGDFTFDTFDQSDEKTWPDQHKDNDKDIWKN